jgi:hypothetical protein
MRANNGAPSSTSAASSSIVQNKEFKNNAGAQGNHLTPNNAKAKNSRITGGRMSIGSMNQN